MEAAGGYIPEMVVCLVVLVVVVDLVDLGPGSTEVGGATQTSPGIMNLKVHAGGCWWYHVGSH